MQIFSPHGLSMYYSCAIASCRSLKGTGRSQMARAGSPATRVFSSHSRSTPMSIGTTHGSTKISGSSPSRTTEESSTATNRFDAEVSRLYKIVSENHRHPAGPWTTMLEKVHEHARTMDDPTQLRVLDLATGPGEPAETIARQLPDCTVVATDLSPDQVALANEQAATLPHMSAVVADMQDLSALEPNFDLVTCCYGFMFPPDIPLAVSESFRVLKPGGKLIATTWNKLTIMAKVRAIMTEMLGEEPPPPPINPMSLSEPGLFESILKEAGYTDIQCTNYSYPFDFTKDPELQFQVSVLTVREKIEEWNAWEKARDAFDKVKDDYGTYHDNGHWIIPGNEYQLTVASKPN